MKTTNKSTVDLIDSMGNDLTVVNAARVSFDRESELVIESDDGDIHYDEPRLSTKDEKLINYLAKHNHWSPFAHTSIQLRVNAPIFVARQLVKHQVGGVWGGSTDGARSPFTGFAATTRKGEPAVQPKR